MTRSMRSRFRDEPPPPQRPQPESSGGGLTIFGHVLLLSLIAGLGTWAVWWMLSDISGEYQTQNRQLGVVRLSLIRQPTTIKGEITYGRLTPLVVTKGSITDGKHLDLKFELPEKALQSGASPRHATFQGDLDGTSIKGTLEEAGYRFDLKFTRSALSSLYRQIQSHLPWVG